MLDVQTIQTDQGSSLPCRVSVTRRDSRSVAWSPSSTDGSFESLLMVAQTDNPLSDDGDGGGRRRYSTVGCDQCGYYIDSNGQQIYGVDYVRYWDCCGAGTASIESKVEQALDLVKSHLMFAVREEVRALRDEMEALIVKHDRLRYENQLLRSHASPDTLALLGIADLSTKSSNLNATDNVRRPAANN